MLVLVPTACQCLKSMTMRNDEWPFGQGTSLCEINNVHVILARYYGCMTIIVLELMDIDLILGMGWMSACKGVIKYAQRSLLLTTPSVW